MIDKNKVTEILNTFGEKTQALCAVEELNELVKPLLKFANRDFSKTEVMHDVLDEVADVLIAIEEVKLIFGITNNLLKQMINYKLDRTLNKIKNLKKDNANNEIHNMEK